MKSTKHAPQTAAEPTPEDRIRQIIALSLCESEVRDNDPLERWTSLDVVEAIVVVERDLGIPEIDDGLLIKCLTIGALVGVINAATRP